MKKRSPTVEELKLVTARAEDLVQRFDACDAQGGSILLDGHTFLLAMMDLYAAIHRLEIDEEGRLGLVLGWPGDVSGAARAIVINLRSVASDLGIDQLFTKDGFAGGVIATKGVHRIREGKRSTEGITFVTKSLSAELVEGQVDRIRKATNLLGRWIQDATEDDARSSEQGMKSKRSRRSTAEIERRFQTLLTAVRLGTFDTHEEALQANGLSRQNIASVRGRQGLFLTAWQEGESLRANRKSVN